MRGDRQAAGSREQTPIPLTYHRFPFLRLLSSTLRVIERWGPALVWMAGIFYSSSRSNPLEFLPPAGQKDPVGNMAHFV